MSQTFAQIVERVQQLSLAEKEELLELLDRLLIETPQRVKPYVVAGDLEKEESGKNLDLTELVSRMPADHQTTEEGFGEPVGKEEW